MATKIRVDLNSEGIAELLKSTELQNELDRRAQRVAAAAGDGFEADTYIGRDRARSVVRATTAKALRAEAQDRALTRALDAARGD